MRLPSAPSTRVKLPFSAGSNPERVTGIILERELLRLLPSESLARWS